MDLITLAKIPLNSLRGLTKSKVLSCISEPEAQNCFQCNNDQKQSYAGQSERTIHKISPNLYSYFPLTVASKIIWTLKPLLGINYFALTKHQNVANN